MLSAMERATPMKTKRRNLSTKTLAHRGRQTGFYILSKFQGVDRPKFFCIGFNKTGTMSLHQFFRENYLFSCHNIQWPLYSRLENGKSYFIRSGDAFSDGEEADFVRLDRWFPNSHFILNTRDTRAWVRSRIKHAMRLNENVTAETVHATKELGYMARDFFTDIELSIEKWIAQKELYEKQVFNYFKGRKSLLSFDLTRSEDWQQGLFQALTEAGYRVNPDSLKKVQKRNTRGEDAIRDEAALARAFETVERIMRRR
jgi:hypothetical protein